MKLYVLLLCVAALLADAYIYKSVICWHFKGLGARIGYIVFALLTDIGVLAALAIYSSATRGDAMIPVMWMVWAFFLTSVPKLLFAVGGFVDFLTRLVIRRRSVVVRSVACLLGVAVMFSMVCGATFWRTTLRVTEVEICSHRLPAEFDGYRIVQFSDVHLGTMPNAERRMSGMVERIAELKPDLVVNTGDLVNLTHNELTMPVAEILSRLSAPDGVYSVWGNHDLGFYMPKDAGLTPEDNLLLLDGEVRKMGWLTLSDRSVWIERDDARILLTGLDYPRGHYHNGNNETMAGVDFDAAYEGIEGTPFNVVMAHTPNLWGEIREHGRGDLTLSGHVHAMQMKIKLLGSKTWSLARYLYENWSGLYVKDDAKNSKLYVNDGIGCVGYPMRLASGARPELTLFILKRCE